MKEAKLFWLDILSSSFWRMILQYLAYALECFVQPTSHTNIRDFGRPDLRMSLALGLTN